MAWRESKTARSPSQLGSHREYGFSEMKDSTELSLGDLRVGDDSTEFVPGGYLRRENSPRLILEFSIFGSHFSIFS